MCILFSQIVETMSFTPEVAEFIKSVGPFYEFVTEDETNTIDLKCNGEDSGVDVSRIEDEVEEQAKELMAVMEQSREILKESELLDESIDEESDIFEEPMAEVYY